LQVETLIANITNIPQIRQIAKNFQPDIVEMIGLLDYLRNQKAVSLFKAIKASLPSYGRFYTCNILPNPERIFLEQVIDWKMTYRTATELRQLLLDAGFEETRARIIVEPMRIHAIAIGDASPSRSTNAFPAPPEIQVPALREFRISAPGVLQ